MSSSSGTPSLAHVGGVPGTSRMNSATATTTTSATAAAAAASHHLPTITASLRNEFIPLLQALEKVNSFASATYMIEVIFALVRFDAFLQREERHFFVRAFDALIAHVLKERRRIEEMRCQLEENRDYLVGLVERCAVLEEMADAKAREEFARQWGFVSTENVSRNPTFAFSGDANAVLTHDRTSHTAPSPQQAQQAETRMTTDGLPTVYRTTTAREFTAPPSMQDSFSGAATAFGAPPSSSHVNVSAYTPGVSNLSFAATQRGYGYGNNDSMSDRHAGMEQAFRTSLRERVERGLSRGSWTVPANLSDLSHVGSQDCLARGNTSFASSGIPREGDAVWGEEQAALTQAKASSNPPSVQRQHLHHRRRRLSGSSLPPLLPTGSGTGMGVPPRPPAAPTTTATGSGDPTALKVTANLPYFPQQHLLQRQQSEVSNVSLAHSPNAPMAATVEGLWEASFWSLLNGADAPADVELLYGLLNAKRRLILPHAAPAGKHARTPHHSHGHHHVSHHSGNSSNHNNNSNSNPNKNSGASDGKNHSGSTNANSGSGEEAHPDRGTGSGKRKPPMPYPFARFAPTPATPQSVLNAVSAGTAEPAQWHTWFTMLAVLSVLSEGFLLGGITAEEEEAKSAAQRLEEQQQRRQQLMRDGEDDGNDFDDIPATPAVSLISGLSANDDTNAVKSGKSLSPLREPSADALVLLQKVYCPSLRNFMVGFENVATAAPVLAARAAGASANMTPNPHGITRVGTASGSLGAGGEDVSLTERSTCSPARRTAPVRSVQEPDAAPSPSTNALTGMSTSKTSASFSPDSFAFPVDTGILSEGGDKAIRPVDLVIHALVTALEVQLETLATSTHVGLCFPDESDAVCEDDGRDGAGSDDGAAAEGRTKRANANDRTAEFTDSPKATAAEVQLPSSAKELSGQPGRRPYDGSPTYMGVQNLSFASVQSGISPVQASQALITTLLQKSFSSAAARSFGAGPATDTSGTVVMSPTSNRPLQAMGGCGMRPGMTDAEEALKEGEEEEYELGSLSLPQAPFISLPAIMKAELQMILDSVTASLGTVTSMAEQLKSEASLLVFRVVSTVLDWLIPAVYLVNHRAWLFYRAWICDLYALMQREGLMEPFTSILDQDGAETTTAGGGTHADAHGHGDEEDTHLFDHEDEHAFSDGMHTPPEPPASPRSASEHSPGKHERGQASATTAALHLHAHRTRKGTGHTATTAGAHVHSTPSAKGSQKTSSPASTSPSSRRASTAKTTHKRPKGTRRSNASGRKPSAGSKKPTVPHPPGSATSDNTPFPSQDGSTPPPPPLPPRESPLVSPSGEDTNRPRQPVESHEDDEHAPLSSDEDEARSSRQGEDEDDGRSSAADDVSSDGHASDEDSAVDQGHHVRHGRRRVSRTRADPFALILPGCNLSIIAPLPATRSHSLTTSAGISANASATSSPVGLDIAAAAALAADGGGSERTTLWRRGTAAAQALIITRGTLTDAEGAGLHYRRVTTDLPPGLQLQRRQRELSLAAPSRPALRLLPEVAPAVRVAQALLDEGTYVPVPRGFMLTRLAAAALRGMDTSAVHSLLAPFSAMGGSATGGRSTASAQATRRASRLDQDGHLLSSAVSDSDVNSRAFSAAARQASQSMDAVDSTLLRASTMSPVSQKPARGFPRTPAGTGPSSYGHADAERSGALTPGPRLSTAGGTGGARKRRGTKVQSRDDDEARTPLREIVRAAPSTIGNQKPATNILSTKPQSTPSTAAHVEGPALVHHHRFRYPVVESVADVGQLYVNTLREAEGMLSPHDPLRAALVQSVVNFYLKELADPLRAIALLDDYLDEVAEEPVQRVVLQPAMVLGDVGFATTSGPSASDGAGAGVSASSVGGPSAAGGATTAATTTSTFSVTSVRRSQQRQLPATMARPSTHHLVNAAEAGGAPPVVPMVIPSWGSKEEELQFLHVLGMLRGLQEVLRAQYSN